MRVFPSVCCLLILAAAQAADNDDRTVILKPLPVIVPVIPSATIPPHPAHPPTRPTIPPTIPTTTQAPVVTCGSMNGLTCRRLPFTGCYCPVTTLMAWRDAYDYCRFNGKSLVSIESAFKAEELKLHLRSLIPAGSIYDVIGFWTSGTLIHRTSSFLWASIPQFFTYIDWMAGQPSGMIANTNNCVRSFSAFNFQWGDLDCGQSLPFFCHSP